ncbi:MAG: glycoside hydrolase family 43 protein [Prevotella sp.]|nr:glycoside hydrolase family 43 protein [Prevotella sp.]
MNKQNIKYWLMGTACLGLLTAVTSCSEDDFPDNTIPTVTPQTPAEYDTQVLWPSNLARVSVHDPSVVYDPSSWSYYIFGSHRGVAKSPNMMTWSTVDVPWAAGGATGVGNDAAFVTPEVTKVKKGGAEADLPVFNAHAWSQKGNAAWSVDGNMWAPDVIYNEKMKKWCMYLSINGDWWYSSIILLTSNSIVGPYTYQAPVVIGGFFDGDNYKETDLELAIGEQASLPERYATGTRWGDRYPNCIDPCVFYDEQGRLWMSYGSWSGGIWMLELDEETGLRDYDVTYTQVGTGDDITVDPYFGKKIAGGHYVSGEASYIEYVDGYYYLFMTYGGLTAGGNPDDYNAGGYQMRMFRSENPDGPFVDSKGSNALFTSYALNFGPNENDGNRGVNIFGASGEWGGQATGAWSERSQGHNSLIAAPDGRTYLVYHSRFQDQGEGHAVRVHQMYQNQDGWLVAAPFEYTGEIAKSAQIGQEQLIATADIPGKYKLLIHNYGLNHLNKALATPVDVELTADGNITGARTGKWETVANTSYINITLAGGAEYKGVMVLQTLEPTNTQVPAFTALRSQTGVTIWGYKSEE